MNFVVAEGAHLVYRAALEREARAARLLAARTPSRDTARRDPLIARAA